MSVEEAKPMMASKSLDTSQGTQAAATSSQPGIQSPIKQETPATDVNVEEEMYVVEVSDDDDSSDKVLNKLKTKEARVSYSMGHIQVVGCAHCGVVPAKREYTVMEYKMKRRASLKEDEVRAGCPRGTGNELRGRCAGEGGNEVSGACACGKGDQV
jgi:hypothetical protein